MLATADYIVIAFYLLIVAGIGGYARRLIKGLDDYFAAGHRVPWWLAAVSHHVSGYSAFAFVGYASLAYEVGFNIWTLFALPCFLAMMSGAFLWAPRWVRLNVITPVEYLEERFNNTVRQVIAWSGIAVKFVDEGTKLYSLAKVIGSCTKLPLNGTIIGCGVVTVSYLMLGGLWAELITDFSQFIIQFSITLLLAPAALKAVGGWRAMWAHPDSPPLKLFSARFPLSRVLVFFPVILLSYNGGTWGLAQRFYSIGKAAEARKAALLSGALYFVYPLILYIPVWAAPALLGGIEDTELAYIAVAQKCLRLPGMPPGMLGLLVAAMFAATMSMVDSDLNALAAVFTKDIYHRVLRKIASARELMTIGLVATAVFGAITVVCGVLTGSLGGAFKAMMDWYAAILAPVSIPLLFGMLNKRTTWRGALACWAGGFATFVLFKYWAANAIWTAWTGAPLDLSIPDVHAGNPSHEAAHWSIFTGAELIVAFGIFFLEGHLFRHTPQEQERVDRLFERLEGRGEEPPADTEADAEAVEEETPPSDSPAPE